MNIIVPLKILSAHELEILLRKTAGRADIIELWLDQVQDWEAFEDRFRAAQQDPEVFGLSGREKFVGVCKRSDENGIFQGTLDQKSARLQSFLEMGGDFVDLDITRTPGSIISGFHKDHLWLSHHDFEEVGEQLPSILKSMELFSPFVYKFAVTPHGPSDIDLFLGFIDTFPRGFNGLFTTMGELGKEGRERIGRKSWGAFYALSEAHKTAEGQRVLE